ncbi:MAG: hypothetical protein AAGD05_12585, partial [Bacteroidota bacterium]
VLLIFSLGTFHAIAKEALTAAPSIATTQTAIKKEFTRTIKKEFDIAADGKVSIINKHGQVNINTWESNQVKIDVVITVHARNQEAANAVFERLNVDFSNGGSYVRAETEIGSKSKGWNWWGSSNSDDYSIDYEVYMPKTNSLELHNKYGNSHIASLAGEVDASIKYGNVRMEEVGGNLKLVLGYGNGTIIKSKDNDVDLKYGKIRIKQANDVVIASKHSKIFIDEAKDIKSISKYDTYEVGQVDHFKNQGKYDNIEIASVGSVRALSKYTDYDIDQIMGSADFDLEYGSATLNMSDDFSEVQILGRYTEYRIQVPNGTEYKLDAATRYAGVRYPQQMNIVYEKEKGKAHEVEGYIGDEQTGRIIKARLDYGGLKVRD